MDRKDTADTEKKKARKKGLIAACLALAVLAVGGGALIYQWTHAPAADTQLDAQARQNGVSTGKAYLAEQVLAINPDLALEDLEALSAEELQDLIKTGAPGMPIGKDAAAAAAEDWSGTRALDFIWVDVDPELDERTPCYEVELHTAWGNYEYRIDAYTGAVLSGRANVLADAPTSEAAPTPAPVATNAPAAETAPASAPARTGDVGEDAAKAAALARAGLTGDGVTWLKVERDYDDGRLEYEMEFRADGMEYECTVDAATGDIWDWESEPVHDRDD